jgi:glycosyltransferase involved in cell wall biosynthesis
MKLVATIERMVPEYGGPYVTLPSLLSSLVENRGWDCSIVSCANERSLSKVNGIGVSFNKLFGPEKFSYSRQIAEDLLHQASGADVIMMNNLWNYTSYVTYSVSKKLKIPLVISPRGSLYPWSLAQGAMRKKLAWVMFQKDALNSSYAIHVTSDAEADAIRRLNIQVPCIVAPHGVEVPSVESLPRRQDSLERLKLPADQRYVLFFSRLHKKKGLDRLLEIWAKIFKDFPNWTLLVVGPDSGGYEKKISNSAIPQTSLAAFPGVHQGYEKELFFSIADFLVLPSFSENFGVVVAESLARNIPVLTTNGTPWDGINDFQCGRFVKSCSIGIEQGLVELLSCSHNELFEMGQRGRAWMIKDYSWVARSELFERLLNAV